VIPVVPQPEPEEFDELVRIGFADFLFLKRRAPFIAYELERQDLIEKIKIIMDYKLELWE